MSKVTITNWRAIAIGTVALVVCSAAVAYWFNHQRSRLSRSLFVRAQQHADEGNVRKASELLFDYTKLSPEDSDGWFFLSKYYRSVADTALAKSRAIEIAQRALTKVDAPERRLLINEWLSQLYLDTQRFSEAKEAATRLPLGNVVGTKVEALAVFQLARLDEPGSTPRRSAMAKLIAASDALPADIQLASAAAEAIRQSPADTAPERNARALAVLDRMVHCEENKSSASALLTRCLFRKSVNDVDWKADLQSAIELVDSASPREMLRVASAIYATESLGGFDVASGLIEKVHESGLFSRASYQLLGAIHQRVGRTAAAADTWEEGVTVLPADDRVQLHDQLAKYYLSSGQVAAAKKHLQAATHCYGRLQSTHAASANATRTRELARVGDAVALTQARILAQAERNSSAAKQLIERRLVLMPADLVGPDAALRAEYLVFLGELFMANESDRAAEHFSAASQLPEADALVTLSASRLLAQGELELAVSACDAALRSNENLLETRLCLAELLLRQQSYEPAHGRDWSDFDKTVETGALLAPESWRFDILRVRRRLLDGALDEATRSSCLKLLATAESKTGTESELFWQLAAELFLRLGENAESARAVARFSDLATTWRVRRLEAGLASIRGDAKSAMSLLNQALDDAPRGDRHGLCRDLAQVASDVLSVLEYRRLLLGIHEEFESDVDVLETLALSYFATNEHEEFESWLNTLRDVEGPSGVRWRWLNAKQLCSGGDSSSEQLESLKMLSAELLELAPRWPKSIAVQGMVLAKQGEHQRAVEALNLAVRKGLHDADVFQQLLIEVIKTGDPDSLDGYLAMLRGSERRSSPHAIPAGWTVSLADDRTWLAGALEKAADAVVRSESLFARIWYAQLLIMDGREADAEQELVKAATSSNSPTAWSLLFHFYATRNVDRAVQALDSLDQALAAAGVDPSLRAFRLARAYHSIHRPSEAASHYQEAISLDPDSFNAHQGLAKLLHTRDPMRAIEALRESLRIRPSSKESRLALAKLLTQWGGAAAWAEVQQLLDDADVPVDGSLKAYLLVQRGGEGNLTAAREQIQSAATRTLDDNILLAVIDEALGDPASAQASYESLNPTTPLERIRVSIYFAEFCLRYANVEVANELIRELDKLTAGRPAIQRLVYHSLNLRTQLLMGSPEDAIAALEAFAERELKTLDVDDEVVEWCDRLGQLYVETHLYGHAEKWQRRSYEVDRSNAGAFSRTLAFLGQHSEAVKLLVENKDESSKDVFLSNVVDVLATNGPVPQGLWAQLDDLLDDAARGNPYFVRYLRAVVAVIRGNERRGIAEFSELLKLRPQDVPTINNLATLLGETEQGKGRALELINRAISIAGPRTALLNTKGMILIELGRPDDALRELEHLSAMVNPDPRALFTLGLAYLRVGDNPRAKALMSRARAAGLDAQLLTQRERSILAEMRQGLE